MQSNSWIMKKDAIKSCLVMLSVIKQRLEQDDTWPEAKEEISELLQVLETELNNGLNSKIRDEKIDRLVSRALWLIGIILGLAD